MCYFSLRITSATVRFHNSAFCELKDGKYLIPGFSVKNKIIWLPAEKKLWTRNTLLQKGLMQNGYKNPGRKVIHAAS
jgi:hypothetical protein